MDFDRMLQYCGGLQANNDRTWFHEHHKEYEAARKEYLELLEVARFAIAQNAPRLADDILYGPAKDWVYRIARDMRYHHNQPPYNPAFRAYISPDRKSWLPIGYFLRIAPGSSCFGTGLWCESTTDTNRIRDYIQQNFEEFDALLHQCPIPLSGEQLKTMRNGAIMPEGSFAVYELDGDCISIRGEATGHTLDFLRGDIFDEKAQNLIFNALSPKD